MYRRILVYISLTFISAIAIEEINQNTQLLPAEYKNADEQIFLQENLKTPSDLAYQNTEENTLSFLQNDLDDTTSDITTDANPLNRDEDDHQLPEDSDDGGDLHTEGDILYVLSTSFIENEEGTGKVWAIPRSSDKETFELLGGLQKPVGICVDINNNFMYVVDAGTADEDGFIYQYEINYNDEGEFTLSNNQYVVIYEGESPYDCKVDEYGNLYFVDSGLNQINAVSYTDLYAGTKNTHYTLYEGNVTNSLISAPVALDLYEDKGIFYVNNEDFDSVGTVNYGEINDTTLSNVQELVVHDYAPWGVTFSDEDRVFYSLDNGEIWGFDTDEPENAFLKVGGLNEPRGLCYGDGDIYFADHYTGSIHMTSDSNDNETAELVVYIQGAYGLFCVNEGDDFAFSLVIKGLSLIAYLLI